MSKSGMNWLLTVAVAVAAGAIGAGAYYLSKEDTSVVAEAEKAVAKLEAAANGKVQLNSSGTQTDKAEAGKAPEVTTQLDTAAVTTDNVPSFDVMRVEPSGDAVVAGRAEAGSIVALISNGDVVGKGIANNSGEFAIVLERPLKPGDHDVSLEATNQETQEKSGSQQHIAVSVPEDETGEVLVVLNEPDAPSKILQLPETPVTAEPVETANAKAPETAAPAEVAVAQIPGAKEEAPVNAAADKPAQAPAKTEVAVTETPAPVNAVSAPAPEAAQTAEAPVEVATQTPAPAETPAAPVAAATEEPQLTVKAVETEKGKVFVAGESEPGAQVRVYVGEEFVGEAQAGTEGRWLVEAEKTIPAGNVEVRADKVENTDGKVEARAQVVFTKGENDVAMIPVRLVAEGSGSKGASATVGIGELPNVIIRRGDNLWTISRRLYGKGTRYTTIYQANSQQIQNPDMIFPGQVFMLPVADLNWKTINN
ncbi:Nucleoid-associated protein YgaU, contains BON and LysM domains [Pseudovibrio ascidiaceicola]|uniref:Nucleoid-associated protein YgaU, contains BON and LysM domains n=1 Tax=Pseudovibrio ascidiaceicola TaxID=285279 RepID=A0A1I4B7T0_9HYPH|nr:Ig-like domain-containing protein [Pseudovibrio ascidiaceicola]SFK64835.1 Nucleoid-associated protein YgaU, contains BON and LysM domains [Pseudovibrio ascidiaceicola]